MLSIEVVLSEKINDKNEFVIRDSFTLEMEHSLASVSKWESKFEKPFLTDVEKTPEEILEYIKCMTLTPEVPEKVYGALSSSNVEKINDHIAAKMTATWFPKHSSSKGNPEIITSEIIYYWMVSCGIPFECETWHLSRLLTLIQVCQRKSTPPKKMSKSEAIRQQRELNARRREQYGSSG